MNVALWKQNPDIAVRSYEDRLMLIDPTHALLHDLDPVGARIWQLCDGRHSELQIAHQICQEFVVSQEEAFRDLQPFLVEMGRKGLLIRVGEK